MINISETDIIQHWQKKLDKPIISICCVTYNHEDCIVQAIEGFLIQETIYPFEILIHDDCSNDNTANIIQAYEKKYPNIIKAIYQNENQFSQGLDVIGINLSRAKGKYIAMCDGDDYWIDPLKLQKQVSFLEKNDDFSFTFHDYNIYDENKKIFIKNASMHNRNYPKTSVYSPEKILLGPYVALTLSIVYRSFIDYPKRIDNLLYQDKPLEKLLAFYGKGYYFSDVMAVYRNHSNSLTKSETWNKTMQNSYLNDSKIYKNLKEMFPEKYSNIIKHRIKFNYAMDKNNKIKIYERIKILNNYSKIRGNTLFHKRMLLCLLISKLYLPNFINRVIEKVYFFYGELFMNYTKKRAIEKL